MSDKIAEIKERHFHDERWRNGPSMGFETICPQTHDDRATLLAEVDRLRAEAAQQLDGYRELAARVNELTLQRDAAVTLLAEWCHAVDVGGAGWDYWDNQYKEARWGKGILRSLIDAEIAKLEQLEGEP